MICIKIFGRNLWGVAACFLLLVMGCKTDATRKATFREYQRAVRRNDFDAQIAVFQAARLSPRDLRNISARRNTDELVGAGAQTVVSDSQGRALLNEAANQAHDAPKVWAALAYWDMSVLANRADDSGAIDKELNDAILKWQILEPSNAVPLYLAAAYQCLQTNIPLASQLIAQADKRLSFETHSIEIQRCIIRAMESAWRSRYIARLVAMGHVSGTVSWYKLSKTLLEGSGDDEEVARQCFALGSRVASHKSFLEQLVGNSIKSKAIDKLPHDDFTDEKAQILKTKVRIKQATNYSNSLAARRLSEKQWVRFLDACFDEGEMRAFEEFAAENGDVF